MRVLPVLLLLLVAPALGQESRPASRPATAPSFDSDETLRLLAASVMPERISATVRQLRAFGPLVPGSDAAERARAWVEKQVVASDDPLPGQRPHQRTVFLSARLSNEHPALAGALLETLRVLVAMRKAGQLGDLGFDIRCKWDEPAEPASRPTSAPSGEILAEIEFFGWDPYMQGEPSGRLFVLVSAEEASRAPLVTRIEHLVGRFKGERGFWKEFEVKQCPPSRRDHAPRVYLGPEGRVDRPFNPESRPATAPASDEVPSAVREARFALMMIASLAAERAK